MKNTAISLNFFDCSHICGFEKLGRGKEHKERKGVAIAAETGSNALNFLGNSKHAYYKNEHEILMEFSHIQSASQPTSLAKSGLNREVEFDCSPYLL